MKPNFIRCVLFISLIVVSSCKEDDIICDPGNSEFDITYFIQAMNDSLQSKPFAGYQIAVNKDGGLYYNNAYGFSRYINDPGGEIPMTPYTRQNVASVSKVIGSIALMNAMKTNMIFPDDKVVDHLPESWWSTIHPDFSDITSDAYLTFSDLLTNYTAIAFLGAGPPSSGKMLSEAEMLTSLQLEPDLSRIDEYQNANFTLIRVLIGQIIYGLNELSLDYSTECTEKYFEYIRETIFDKLEINGPLTPQSVLDYYNIPNYPLGYKYPFDATPVNQNGFIGWNHKNNPLNAGSSGLLLSSFELSKLLKAFKYDNPVAIISSTQRDLILNGNEDSKPFGFTSTLRNQEHGTYYGKNGAKSNDNCCERSLRSLIMCFPNDIEIAILTNFSHERLRRMTAENYDLSYRNECN
jgi:hypothetical protein